MSGLWSQRSLREMWSSLTIETGDPAELSSKCSMFSLDTRHWTVLGDDWVGVELSRSHTKRFPQTVTIERNDWWRWILVGEEGNCTWGITFSPFLASPHLQNFGLFSLLAEIHFIERQIVNKQGKIILKLWSCLKTFHFKLIAIRVGVELQDRLVIITIIVRHLAVDIMLCCRMQMWLF